MHLEGVTIMRRTFWWFGFLAAFVALAVDDATALGCHRRGRRCNSQPAACYCNGAAASTQQLGTAGAARFATATADEDDGEHFEGEHRADAKLSIPDAPFQFFEKLDDLFPTLEADKFMKEEHQPKITYSTDRQPEEQRNVTVNAYLYAASKEGDNDFHLILGSSPQKSKAKFFTAEISALPKSGQYQQPIRAARDQFKDGWTSSTGKTLPGGGYKFTDSPIQVKVSGALFFDVDPHPGGVGPAGYKPTRRWEIHPVTAITFQPNN